MQLADLRKYGIPERVLSLWRRRQGESLLPVQRRAIRKGLLDPKAAERPGNMLICAPTSSGKSYCAEMAAVKALTERRKTVMLFPLKSLAEEKYRLLNDTYGPLGVRCLISTGDHPENDRRFAEGDYQIAVAIYEKFDLLLTADLDALKTIGVIVVDELQMIAERGRGAVLERLLTRTRASCYRPTVIALSAAIGDIDAARLASWLDAEVIEETVRPVDLLRGVAAAGSLAYRSYNSGQDASEPFADIASGGDSIMAVIDLLKTQSGSTLVFLKSRMDTVNLAFRLAAAVGWPPASMALSRLEDEEPSFLTRSLRQALSRGVAFHNSDLSSEQRNIIEQSFVNKEIRVMFSTTTLAMGVNLPADTVYLETVKYSGVEYDGRPAMVPISRAEFENMTGRAGRLGLSGGEPGRAIVLAESEFDRDILWDRYIAAGPSGPVTSAFDSLPVEDWLLPVIACRLAARRQDIDRVYGQSFRAVCRPESCPDIENGLRRLLDHDFVEAGSDGSLGATPIGRSTAISGLEVRQAIYYCRQIAANQPEGHFGWLALALSAPGWDLPPGILTRSELLDNGPLRMLYRRFDHRLNDARYILPAEHRQQPVSYRLAAALKSLLLLEDWIALAPVQRLEEQYQVHLGHIMAMGETAAHLINGLTSLVTALEHDSPAIGGLTVLSFSLRFGLPADLREIHRHLGTVLNRSDFLALRKGGISGLRELASADLDTVIRSKAKRLQISEILAKLKEEVSMATAHMAISSTALSEPELVEIDGTFDRERYLVKIDGFPVRLTGKSFKYFTKLAWSRVKRDSGWVYKEDIEVGFNQARYLYRMKNEILADLNSEWPIIENNRLGYYRLNVDPEKIRINTQNLKNHPDYEIRSLVIPADPASSGDSASVH